MPGKDNVMPGSYFNVPILSYQGRDYIQYLLVGCETLASTKYLYQHNMVARVVHGTSVLPFIFLGL